MVRVRTCRMAWAFALVLAAPFSCATGQIATPLLDFEVDRQHFTSKVYSLESIGSGLRVAKLWSACGRRKK